MIGNLPSPSINTNPLTVTNKDSAFSAINVNASDGTIAGVISGNTVNTAPTQGQIVLSKSGAILIGAGNGTLTLRSFGARVEVLSGSTTGCAIDYTGAFTAFFINLPAIISPQASSPGATGGLGTLWVSSAVNHFYFYNGTAMVQLDLTPDTGWTANADAGSKTASIPANSGTIQAALNVVSAGAGDAFVAVQSKVKAIETALSTFLLPNA